MSKRESRNSLNVRQNDALFEFENFKKKFLLANKHITKLNSTLSVRIEELNAQISTLYVENLRLRASEIALTAQLKKERDKSRKIMADTEAASFNLTRHLAVIRQSFGIPSGRSSPASTAPPSQPRARRPPPPNFNSPQTMRLSRAPNVSEIYEEDEDHSSSLSADDGRQPSPTRRKSKAKARLSVSKLPLPLRVSSPPPPIPVIPPMHADLNRKKPSRRQSGLLNVNSIGGSSLVPPRPSSPAFGSPIRREAALATATATATEDDEEEVEIMPVHGLSQARDQEVEVVVVDGERKGKGRERDSESGSSSANSAKSRERKRPREEDYDYPGITVTATADGKPTKAKSKLKDVTNSPRGRNKLPPLDVNVPIHDRRSPDTEPPSTVTSTSTRNFLSTPATTPAPTPTPYSSTSASYLLTPRASSSPPQPQPPQQEVDGEQNGRERRARKSVNYAEPKLNTKMRKPDPIPGSGTTTNGGTRKRALSMSTATTMSTTTNFLGLQSDEPRSSIEEHHPPISHVPPLPASIALPPSRPSSSASIHEHPVTKSTTTSTSNSAAATTIKRKKSRPLIDDDEDEDEGAQADAEFVVRTGWVNLEGRRKNVFHGGVRRGGVSVDEEGRRRSMAV